MLKPCPACGNKVSTQAPTCPHCGHPLVGSGGGPVQKKDERRGGWGKWTAGLPVLGLLLLGIRIGQGLLKNGEFDQVADAARAKAEAELARAKAEAPVWSPKSQAEVDRERFIGRWQEQGSLGKYEFFRDGTLNATSPIFSSFGKWSVLDDGRIKLEVPNLLKRWVGGNDSTTLWQYSFDSEEQLTLTLQDTALKAVYVRLR